MPLIKSQATNTEERPIVHVGDADMQEVNSLDQSVPAITLQDSSTQTEATQVSTGTKPKTPPGVSDTGTKPKTPPRVTNVGTKPKTPPGISNAGAQAVAEQAAKNTQAC